MGMIRIDGNDVFVRETGDPASPPLILVHGLYGDSTSTIALAEPFAKHFHVVAPDALGHGRSARPAGFTLRDQGRMLTGLAEALGCGAPTALVGISMGSYLAAQAAMIAPQRFSHLVLVVAKAQGSTSSTVAYAKRMGIDLSTVTPEQMVALMAGALWSPATSQQRRDEIMAAQLALLVRGDDDAPVVLTPQEKAAVDASLAGFDLRPGLPGITAKTLVISGRSDGLNPPEAGAEVADLIPGARFEVYENSGHMLVFEEADRFVAEVSEFLLA